MKPPSPLIPDRLRDALEPLRAAGVLEATDVAICRTLTDDATPVGVVLAITLVSVALRHGHTCLDLNDISSLIEATRPEDSSAAAGSTVTDSDSTESPDAQFDAAGGVDTLRTSPLVECVSPGTSLTFDRPLVLDAEHKRLWFARYAHYEQQVAAALIARAAAPGQLGAPETIRAAVESAFGGSINASDPQRSAVVAALSRKVSVITGGPGTGKTWTVGRLVEAAGILGLDGAADIALAAPTGKAAERLTEAAEGHLEATTIHRLLAMRPGDTRRRRSEPIPQRLVIVDESSMIALPMMARLFEAVRPDAHLVFVGDPAQLVSVEVGSVLRDVVDAAEPPTSPIHDIVTTLTTVRRQSEGSPIISLAEAIHTGNAKQVVELLDDPTIPSINRVAPDRLAEVLEEAQTAARKMVVAARAGDAAGALAVAKSYRVLSATRHGRTGLNEWSRRIRQSVGFREDDWRVGRPVIVSRNDPINGVFNGDTGVVVPDPNDADDVRVAFVSGSEIRYLPPTSLHEVEDWWAMTIHKSQGSEYGHVVASLPEQISPILTRELLYTAVTRAQDSVTIVGSPKAIEHAVTTAIARSSGLVDRFR